MKNILIVDDSAYMRLNLKKILMKSGFKSITEASNGQEAVERVKDQNFDLILMDITMPVLNGLDALKTIHEEKPDSKVVIISSEGEGETMMKAIQDGAMNFILKPFKETQVIEVINQYLNVEE